MLIFASILMCINLLFSIVPSYQEKIGNVEVVSRMYNGNEPFLWLSVVLLVFSIINQIEKKRFNTVLIPLIVLYSTYSLVTAIKYLQLLQDLGSNYSLIVPVFSIILSSLCFLAMFLMAKTYLTDRIKKTKQTIEITNPTNTPVTKGDVWKCTKCGHINPATTNQCEVCRIRK